MLTKRWMGALLVPLLTVGCSSSDSAQCSPVCAGPDISASAETALPGHMITVRGGALAEGLGCYCEGEEPTGYDPQPLQEINVFLQNAEGRTELATVDADGQFGFSHQVQVPVDAEPGLASIRIVGPGGVELRTELTILAATE